MVSNSEGREAPGFVQPHGSTARQSCGDGVVMHLSGSYTKLHM